MRPKRPNHVCHIDLITMATHMGLWCPWLPFAWPQCWPFWWWLAVVLDHYSRRVMGFAVFRKAPTSVAVRTALGASHACRWDRTKYLINDKGRQFWPTGLVSTARHPTALRRPQAGAAVLPFWSVP